MSAKCKSCERPIAWLKTSTGKPIPVEPETVREGDTIFVPGLHEAHFAKCPQADQHRKPRQRGLFEKE